MKNRLRPLLSAILPGLALLFLTTCERDWNNPWDEFTNLSPEAWAPQNLQIIDVSITEKKLTWTYADRNIEGFKIDRKKGGEPWQVAYQTLPKETRNWSDAEIIPDPSLTYEYRVYAFAGKNSSSEVTKSITANFAAPTNLQTEKLFDKSYKLTWTDNSTGEQGFKIDRKIDENDWIIGFGNVPANQTSFTDTNVFRATSLEYRVYGFYEGCESGKDTVATSAELTSPSDLLIEKLSDKSYRLTWTDNSDGEEGFKIDRRIDSETWIIAYGKMTSNQNFFIDTNVFRAVNVEYQVYAFSGSMESQKIFANTNVELPAPSSLLMTPNSIVSVTLSWQENINGEEGFKIDRKLNSGVWELNFATVGSNQISYSDNNVDWQTNGYSYRVYSFFGKYNSSSVESAISWPNVTTAAGSNITYNSATSGGSIAIQGNYSITARGVCYGTSTNPDLSGPHTTDASGTGIFVSSINGLSCLTTYYLRAYATTDFGTVYGENRNFTTLSPDIGDTYAGGIVFYLDGSGGGLVCAPSDQSAGAEWGCYGTTNGGTSTAIGTGAANTAAIVAGCSQTGIAARICNDLVLNGYSDWFLPSKYELNLMYVNLKQAGIGGFASALYWSSSEYSSTNAWLQYFYSGGLNDYYKNVTLYVRAVRAF